MKPQQFAAAVGFLLLAVIILMVTGQGQRIVSPEAPSPDRRIAVIGEGEFRIKANLVQVSFGVTNIRASAAEAEALNLAFLSGIRAALLAAGGEAEHLEVGHPLVSAITHQDYAGELRITGFQASARVTVSLKNLARLQNLMDAALAAGATSVEEVSYHVDDPELVKQQTLARALENARTRARALLASDEATLGSLIAIEVLTDPSSLATSGEASLIYRARIQAVFDY